MRKIVLLLLVSCVFQSCVNSHSVSKVLDRSKKEIAKLKAIEYEARYKTYSPGNDTLVVSGTVQLLKDAKVTELGFKTSIVYQDYAGLGPGAVYFTGDTIYTVSHTMRKIWVSEVAKVGTQSLTGNLNKAVIGNCFSAADPYPANFMSGRKTYQYKGSAKVQNQVCLVIKGEGTDTSQNARLAETYFISKKTALPVKVESVFQFQDQQNFSVWEARKLIVIKDWGNDVFPEKHVPENYAWEIQQPIDPDYYKLLPPGQPAPNFELAALNSGKQNLTNLKGKIVILDFWYQSCAPCLKAIPHLQELQMKYQNQGLVVLGLNSKDNGEKRMARLKDFVKNRNLNYPVLLSTPETDNLYQVKAYPTLYLIDQEGNIAFAEIGFSGEMLPELEAEIQKLLAKSKLQK